MEVTRCARCGVFYTNGGYVCAKCQAKDNLELSTFKNFIEKNDSELTTLEDVSGETGISVNNLNRFLNYKGLEGYQKLFI